MTTPAPRALLLLMLTAGLAGCAGPAAQTPTVQTPVAQTPAAQTPPSGQALNAQAVSGPFSRWGQTWTASSWKNGDPLFGCTFSPANITLGSGSDTAVYGWLDSSTCSELKSNRYKSQGNAFGGDIFVPNISGTTSTLFTYLDDGNVWNEIDAEFVPGRGLHPALIYRGSRGGVRYIYQAWVPATAGAWHTFKVDWQSTTITWTLDGRVVFTMIRDSTLGLGAAVVTGSGSSMRIPAQAWPTRSQQLIANFWRGSNTGDSVGFLGSYTGGTGNAIWNNLY